MRDLKIEYINGQMVTLDIDGQSQLAHAVQSIELTHENGCTPVFKITTALATVAQETTPETESV